MTKEVKKLYDVVMQIILFLFVIVAYVSTMIGEQEMISFFIPIMLIVFIVMYFSTQKLIIKPTYLSVMGSLALLITSIYIALLFNERGMQNREMAIYSLILIVPVIPIVMLIDRIFVNIFGTKKVNKVEKIIVLILLAPIIFQIIFMQIQLIIE